MMVDGRCSKANPSGKLEIHFGRTAAASCVSSVAFNFTVRLYRLSCATISCVTISCRQVASVCLQSNLHWRVADNSWASALFRAGRVAAYGLCACCCPVSLSCCTSCSTNNSRRAGSSEWYLEYLRGCAEIGSTVPQVRLRQAVRRVDPAPLPLLPSYVCPPARAPFCGRPTCLLLLTWNHCIATEKPSCLPANFAVSISSNSILYLPKR